MENFYYAVKVLVSAGVIVLVAEIAKRNIFLGALLVSIPLTSVLAFVWLFAETGDMQRISALSLSIFWLVLPSLVLFLLLPLLIKLGWGFWLSLIVALLATAASYGLMVMALKQFGIQL